jgi:hypothetical protein
MEGTMSETGSRVDNAQAGVKKISGFLSDIKTISVIAVAVVGGVFYAGIYFYQARETINQALDTFKRNDETIRRLTSDVEAPRNTADKLKASLPQWAPAVRDGTMSGPGGGTTYMPSMCPDGYYAVGLRTWGARHDQILHRLPRWCSVDLPTFED